MNSLYFDRRVYCLQKEMARHAGLYFLQYYSTLLNDGFSWIEPENLVSENEFITLHSELKKVIN